jgi:hypothetical protein
MDPLGADSSVQHVVHGGHDRSRNGGSQTRSECTPTFIESTIDWMIINQIMDDLGGDR